MPLNGNDYMTILRLLQSRLLEADPEAVEIVNRAVGLRETAFAPAEDPKAAALQYMDALIKVMSERSAGKNGRILNLANSYIRTESGKPIQALTVQLSPADQEIYGAESYDLARLPDRSRFLKQLRDLRDEIQEDDTFAEGQ